jgi:hypothetical protein
MGPLLPQSALLPITYCTSIIAEHFVLFRSGLAHPAKKSDGGRTSSFETTCQESEYSCPSKGGAGPFFLSSITPSCPASNPPGSHSQQCRIPCLRYFHPSCCLQSLANGTELNINMPCLNSIKSTSSSESYCAARKSIPTNPRTRC